MVYWMATIENPEVAGSCLVDCVFSLIDEFKKVSQMHFVITVNYIYVVINKINQM